MAPTGRKKKPQKGKEQKDSESSTPQSSVPSVDDDDQKLLQRGACGSSGTRQSRSPVKSTTAKRRTAAGKDPSYQSLPTTSSNSAPRPERSPEKSRLAVADQRSRVVCPSSPSKKNILTNWKSKLSPKKRSPNRSTNSECQCESKTNHKPDCPEFNVKVDAKRKSPKKLDESMASSSSVSAVISKRGVASVQSSDPSVKESSSTALQSERLLEQNLLAVADQEKVSVTPRSPAKKSIFSNLKQKIMSPKRSPDRSRDGSVCRCTNRNDHELECPERRKREADAKTDSSRSETSSSSASPIILKKKKESDASNTSSENSRSSKSKSSSSSGANAKDFLHPGRRHTPESSPSRKNRRSPSRNQKDYDPLEGTSSGSAGRAHNRRYSVEDYLEFLRNRFRRIRELENPSEADGEPDGERLEPVIENIEDAYSEEEGVKVEIPRKRSKSFLSNIFIRQRKYPRKPHSKAQSDDGSNSDTQRGAEVARQNPSVRRKDRKLQRADAIDVDTQEVTEADSSVGLKEVSVGFKDLSVRRKDPSVTKKDAAIRRDARDVDTQRSAEAGRTDASVRREDPQFRQGDVRDLNTRRRSPIRRPRLNADENRIIRESRSTGPVPSVRRHQSLSPYPLDACQCGHRYIHVIGCSREIKARRMRKRKKCRQDMPEFQSSKDEKAKDEKAKDEKAKDEKAKDEKAKDDSEGT